MANGDADTVQVQMPDGRVLTGPRKNLPIAMSMGGKLYKPAAPKPESDLKAFGRGAALGGFSGLGIPETQHPIKDLWKNVTTPPTKKEQIEHLVDPTLGALPAAVKMGKGLYQSAKEAVTAKSPEEAGHGFGSALTQALQLGGMGDIGADAGGRAVDPVAIADHSTKQAKGVLASIFNEGATREKMQKLQDYDALTTKSKLSKLDKTVEKDAGGLMDQTSKAVDKKFPEGVTDLQDTAKVIKQGLGDRVKAKTLRSKLPSSMDKILSEAGGGEKAKGTAVRLTNNELQTLNVLQKEGAKGEDLRGSLVNMGYAPKQIDAMMQVASGTEAKPQLAGFEKMKQLRTELGKELFTNSAEKYPGAVRRVMYDAWKNMTDQLDTAAEKAGLADDWTRGKHKWSDYIRDFYGTWERGAYKQSPIDKALKGQNAHEIMNPLSGDSAQHIRDLLAKYKQFGLDPKEVARDVRRYSTNQKVMRFASPSKWDIIIGGMALYRPEFGIPAFVARYGLPRALEHIIARRAETIPASRPSIASVPEGTTQ